RPVRGADVRATLAAGDGCVVFGTAALSDPAAGADRPAHADVGGRVESPGTHRALRRRPSARRAGLARAGDYLLRADGAATGAQRGRERRRVLARGCDPGGIPLGAGAVPDGQQPRFAAARCRVMESGADASRVPATIRRNRRHTPRRRASPVAATGPRIWLRETGWIRRHRLTIRTR